MEQGQISREVTVLSCYLLYDYLTQKAVQELKAGPCGTCKDYPCEESTEHLIAWVMSDFRTICRNN